ncbi:hypothetical protein NDU88_003838 [Pleurodeles waltl]|uniref:Uncharacterized protein n=1 Tax=Pleurodeles waltl TaxID=8319 RepID=A0AAV7PAP8_PLEWA|nr:hypothetical protein NDU88_003838 [Pleurodeles waltl]
MKGHYPCEQVLAAAAFAVQKSATIVMGSPLTLYVEHAVFAILQKSKSTLTTQRVSGYEVILSIPSLQVVRCHTVNPATFFAHPVSEDEQVHDCATYTPEEESEIREDPIPGSMLLFVDGSSFIDQETGIRHSGAAVVRAEQQGSSDTLQIVSQIPLPSHFSAQAAELVAMIEALQHAEGLEVTIYSDSAYVTTTVHSSIRRWERRGFLKSDGSPVMHKDLLEQLIKALALPSKVAVIKCAAHTNQQDLISRGNALAEWAAKEVAQTSPNFSEQDEHTLGMMINRQQSVTELPPPYTETARLHLRELQEQALPHERELWEQRVCIQSPTDFIYRQESTGKPVMPQALLYIALEQLHLPAHTAKEYLLATLQTDWFIPQLSEMITMYIAECTVCQQYSPRPTLKVITSTIPRPTGPFKNLHLDFVDMIERCNNYRYLIVVVCPFSRWIEAGPCVHNDAKAAANFLIREVIPRWGIAEAIRSDNGTHFVNAMFQHICTSLGIKHKLSSVYYPQSNGIVEHLNGLLKNKISKLCVTMNKNWLYCLPLALYALGNQPGSDHHLTPHQIVTGRPMPTPLTIARQRTDAQKTAEVLGQEMSSYLSQLLKSVKFFSKQVARQEKCTNAAQQTSPISVGQQVYIRNFVRRWKDSKFEGPYLVTQSTPTAVKVEGRKPWIHLSDVRLSPASCHTSPSSQEHLQQDKDKDKGQRPS